MFDSTIPTVAIVADTPTGYLLINKSEFDPEIHQEYVEPSEPAPKSKAKATAETSKSAES